MHLCKQCNSRRKKKNGKHRKHKSKRARKNMFNNILHFKHKKGKQYLPNPGPSLRFVFKEGEIEHIKRLKGYKSDRELAENLGFTKQYISMLKSRVVQATPEVITRIAYLTNNIKGNWHIHFEIVFRGEPVDPNHPLWNMAKYEGKVPYSRYSESAQLRSSDYKVEKKT